MAVALHPSPEYLALRSALEKVVHGWTQGAYWRSRSGGHECRPENARRFDLAYAVELSATEHGLDPEGLRGLVLAELGGPWKLDLVYGLERWNDARLRSKGDVVMVLERTLENLA